MSVPVFEIHFGASLVAADFNGDKADDLAVGIPYQSNTAVNQGYVQVFYSNGAILATAGQDLWSQGAVIGSPDFQDFMGWSLGAGDFDGNGIEDLTVGVPYEDVLMEGVDEQDAGAIHAIYGAEGGLTAVGNQIWLQQSEGIAGVSQPNDHFGLAMSR